MSLSCFPRGIFPTKYVIYCSKKVSRICMHTFAPSAPNSMSTFKPASQLPENSRNKSHESGPETTLSKRARKRKLREEKWNAIKREIREKKRQKRRAENGGQVNFNQDCLQETAYYFENGLRKVYPYHYVFNTHAKGRWVNQRIIDVFSKEFRHDTAENYLKAIEAGKVTVNGHQVEAAYVLKDNDYVENLVHRHELPVTGEHIPVLHEDSDVLVVDKPSSIPIHPCGRYRHNSLTFILDKDYGYKNLRTLYRLDRLTSGVMIFAKSEKVARHMQDSIKDRQVFKEYLCRVDGEFPVGEVTVCEPVDVLSRKLGLYKVCPTGKEATTHMERLSCDGKSSVVRCRPLTGRTHQIRVHLQWLGFPIMNDPLYNSPVWGPQRGKHGDWGKSEEQLVADLLIHHSPENHRVEPAASDSSAEQGPATSHSHPKYTDTTADSPKAASSPTESLLQGETMAPVISKSPHDETTLDQSVQDDRVNVSLDESTASCSGDAVTCSSHPGMGTADDLPQFDASKLVVDPSCSYCGLTYDDPRPHNLVMYLHAYRYKGPGWEYNTSIPDWSKEDWQEPERL